MAKYNQYAEKCRLICNLSYTQWVDDYCIVCPCNEIIKLDALHRSRYEGLVGNINLHSIFLAQEHNGLLLTDEGAIKGIAQQEFNVHSCSSYYLYEFFVRRKKATIAQLKSESLKLFQLGYRLMPVNIDILFGCLQINEVKDNIIFRNALKTFVISDIASSIVVSSRFLRKVYLEINTASYIEQITITTLYGLIDNKKTLWAIAILTALKTQLHRDFKLMQKQLDEVIEVVDIAITQLDRNKLI